MVTFRDAPKGVSSILNVEDSLEEWWMWEASIPATRNKCRNAFWNPGLKCKSSLLHLFAFWSSLDSRPIVCKISDDIPAWQMTEPFRQQKRRAKDEEGIFVSSSSPQSQFTLLPGECAVEPGRPSYQCLSGVGQWLVSHTGPQWSAEKTNDVSVSSPYPPPLVVWSSLSLSDLPWGFFFLREDHLFTFLHVFLMSVPLLTVPQGFIMHIQSWWTALKHCEGHHFN